MQKNGQGRREEMRKALDDLLSATNVKRLTKEFVKAKDVTDAEQVGVVYDASAKKLRVRQMAALNDIIEFDDGMGIEKAVVTAIGRDGVTARDTAQQKVLVRWKQIVGLHKRIQKFKDKQ